MKAKVHGVIGRGVKECYVNDENILIFVMSDGKEVPIGFTGELKGIVPIDLGGTNAKNPADARKNLGITPGNIGAATSAEVDVERNRINNLASLKNGSTTGDAELTDIRVGYDGTTYPTAGEAVRGQVGELKGDLVSQIPFVNPIYPLYSKFVNKSYNGTKWVDNAKRIGFINPVYSDSEIKLKCDNGYNVVIDVWNSSDWEDGRISSSAWADSANIEKGVYFTILVKRVDESDISINEAYHVYENSLYNSIESLTKQNDIVSSYVSNNDIIFANKNLFENKVWSTTYGYANSSVRICNTTLIYTDRDITLRAKNGYQITRNVFRNNNTSEQPIYTLEPWASEYTIPANVWFNINVRKIDDSQIKPDEIINIYQDLNANIISDIAEIKGFTEYLKNNKIIISDKSVKGVNAQCMDFDADTGLAYIVYMGSDAQYGESSQKIWLAEFPIANPNNVQNYIVAENGVNGIDLCYEPNLIVLDNVVRIVFANMVNYEYRNVITDFDKTTKTFSSLIEQKYTDGTTVSTSNTNSYLAENGYDVSEMSIAYQAMTNFSKPHNGYIYTVITSHKQIGIVCRSSDNMLTIERVGFLPYLTVGEIALGFIGERLYFLARLFDSTNNNFYYSDDYGATITEIGKVAMQFSKPTMFEYNDTLIVCRNTPDYSVETVNTMGRYQITVAQFDGTSWENLFIANNYYGIVYTMILNYKGQLIATFSEGSLFYDKNTEGKDTVDFINFGRLDKLLH